MDKLTPEILMTFLVVAAALIGFILVCWNLIDKIRAAHQPKDELQGWQRDTDEKLKRDKERLDVLEDGNKVICRGILALLSHEINGNSTDKLKASQSEITNYLIDR